MNTTPFHLAVIMDGNGRWATARGLERLKGHVRGVETVRDVVEACPELGITHLTIYAFSTENWKRTEHEVTGLMTLFRRYIRSEANALKAEGVRVRFIGDRSRLEDKLQKLMAELEDMTATNTRLHFTIAINYGGRDELTRAVHKIAKAAKLGMLDPEEICEDRLSHFLDTAELPDPDLLIRTSGELRTSNFLPWQAAYAELAFTDTAWPDFTVAELRGILDDFRTRDRRYGVATGQETGTA